MTSFAVISDRGTKVPLVGDGMLPEVALLNAEFLKTLPGKAVADTGMDALSHGMESFISTGRNPFADSLAESSVYLIWRQLPQAVTGDQEGRAAMLTASCMAGAAFNSASLGICHSLSHALGGRFHIPHGRLNSVLLPVVVRFNARLEGSLTGAAEQYARLAKGCGLTGSGGRAEVFALLRGLNRLRERLDLPRTLVDAGIDSQALKSAIPELAKAAMEDVCTATNPRPVCPADLERLLKEAL